MTITGNFERSQYINSETNFLKNQNLSEKTGVPFFVESTRIETQYFNTKLSSQKPMLRQIIWGVQDKPITKNGVLPVTTLIFRKFCLSLRTSYKELI